MMYCANAMWVTRLIFRGTEGARRLEAEGLSKLVCPNGTNSSDRHYNLLNYKPDTYRLSCSQKWCRIERLSLFCMRKGGIFQRGSEVKGRRYTQGQVRVYGEVRTCQTSSLIFLLRMGWAIQATLPFKKLWLIKCLNFSYAHQGCLFDQNTVKTVML